MSHFMLRQLLQCPLLLFSVLAVGSCTPDAEEREDGARERVVSGSKVRMKINADYAFPLVTIQQAKGIPNEGDSKNISKYCIHRFCIVL